MDASTRTRLGELASAARYSAEEISRHTEAIAAELLAESAYLTEPNFQVIHPDDLARLFDGYDRRFFGGLCESALGASPLAFRLSRRMSRRGGSMTRHGRRDRPEEQRFEISISSTLLFQSFDDASRPVAVNGLTCRHRLDALMRIMEHELIHLVEMLAWDQSSCSGARFQGIALRMFGHTDYRHQLVTSREIAESTFGVRPGSRVRFRLDGVEHTGLINRITRRATVLVESAAGVPYSDGKRYSAYYVPLPLLEPVEGP